MTTTANHFDVIVIGGGPAGSAASAILAEHGHRVLVLEREKFPRYHIGESLIPFTYQPLERLGLIPRMKQSAFQKKYSVVFISPNGKASQPFYFFNRYDRESVAQTWQVLRSEFDEMLLNHARSKGAQVVEEIAVKELIWENPSQGSSRRESALTNNSANRTQHDGFDQSGLTSAATSRVLGVRAQKKSGEIVEFRAPITLDCTGKEAFAAVRNGWRMKDPYLNKVAVWTYYQGSKREPGIDEGQTAVAYVPEKGWFWHIPQHNDMVSVGVVAEGKYLTRDGVREPEQIFKREIGQNLWIKEHLSVGRQVGSYYLISEYSHHSRHCGCEGLLLVGDAFAFLDPVFSSGLMLALKSGVLVADEVHKAIIERDFSTQRFANYGRFMREGIENMRKLVYAFYDPKFSFKQVIDKYPEAAGEITDCLSGDVNKDFSSLWQKIREFVPLPDDLPVGEPLK
ncbi:MAG: NAD(P)/FAD-dependent oxidoreductase [Verrucomicrobiota bacterium]